MDPPADRHRERIPRAPRRERAGGLGRRRAGSSPPTDGGTTWHADSIPARRASPSRRARARRSPGWALARHSRDPRRHASTSRRMVARAGAPVREHHHRRCSSMGWPSGMPGTASPSATPRRYVPGRHDRRRRCHWSRIPVERAAQSRAGRSGFRASGTAITVRGTGEVWIATGGGPARGSHSTERGSTWDVFETAATGSTAKGLFGSRSRIGSRAWRLVATISRGSVGRQSAADRGWRTTGDSIEPGLVGSSYGVVHVRAGAIWPSDPAAARGPGIGAAPGPGSRAPGSIRGAAPEASAGPRESRDASPGLPADPAHASDATSRPISATALTSASKSSRRLRWLVMDTRMANRPFSVVAEGTAIPRS